MSRIVPNDPAQYQAYLQALTQWQARNSATGGHAGDQPALPPMHEEPDAPTGGPNSRAQQQALDTWGHVPPKEAASGIYTTDTGLPPPDDGRNHGNPTTHFNDGASGASGGGGTFPTPPTDRYLPGTQVNAGESEQIRAGQLNYIKALEGRMAGNAPSVAQTQYNLAQGDIARTNLGMAAQARGADAVLARRQAMQGIADQTQRAGLGQALVRAQESATAADQLGGALGMTRGQDIGVAGANAGLTADANKTSFLEGGLNDRYGAGLVQQMKLANMANATQRYGIDRGKENQAPWWFGPAFAGAGTFGAGLLLSDERVKRDVEPTSKKDRREFFQALRLHRYRYKEGVDDGGDREHHGPMAQELERSRIGRSMVLTGPDGVKRVDTGRLTLALAGAMAEQAAER
jgi:hypothetical protein